MSGIRPADVSLYVPVRNAARTLARTIERIRGLSPHPAEVYLVVDTRSRDTSVKLAEESGLRIVVQDHGRLGHARNLAIQACRTEWLASCDSDVELESDWLEHLLAAADGDVAAVGGCTLELPYTAADRWRGVNLPHNWGSAPFDNPFMLVSEMLARVDALRSIGGYRADLQSWEDSDLCQRLRHAGYTLRYEPKAVGHHDRRDSAESVLDLRWFYSSYRQRSHLESLAGLESKLAVNRIYAMQSLAQTIRSEHADTAAISILLWFHHACRDLQDAVSRWPLLDPRFLQTCSARLIAALASCLRDEWSPLAAPMRQLLPRLFADVRQGTDVQRSPGGEPGAAARGSLCTTAGFRRFILKVHEATHALLDAVPADAVPFLVQSAEALACSQNGHAAPAPTVPPALLRLSPNDQRRIETAPVQPAWHWDEVRERTEAALNVDLEGASVQVAGRHLAPEVPATVGGNPPELLLIPHLEAAADPLRDLRQALEEPADLAMLAYRAPLDFTPGRPILTARDIASQCAAAGFAIEHFETEAGLTKLLLRRRRNGAAAGRDRSLVRAGAG